MEESLWFSYKTRHYLNLSPKITLSFTADRFHPALAKVCSLLLVERNTATTPEKKSIELDPNLISRWMEKLWDHTGLDISLFDVYVPNNNPSPPCSPPPPPFYLSLSHFVSSVLTACECVRIPTWNLQHNTTTWQMLCSASYTAQWFDAVLEQICYISMPAWLEYLLKPSAKCCSIYLWQRGEQYYLHQFSPGRGNFQLMDFFFSSPVSCFNTQF